MDNKEIRKKIIITEVTLVVGILARDCVTHLRLNIPRIEQLGSMFADYHVVILENDSKDGTAEEVKAWGKRNDHVLAISGLSKSSKPLPHEECPHPDKGFRRIDKMVRLRNRVMDEIEVRYNPDILCFIDIDIQSFSPIEVVQAIEHAPNDWGGLFANGIVYWDDFMGHTSIRPMQYDTYAYVPAGCDYTQQDDYVVTDFFHPQTGYKMMSDIQQTDYLACESAFNGIGIYRYEAIKGERYATLQNEALKAMNCSFCEHVGFNYRVKEKGYGLYIAKQMRVEYIHENIQEMIPIIVKDYHGIFSLPDSELPEPVKALKPGMLAIISGYYQQKIDVDRLKSELSKLRSKKRRYLRMVRILAVICTTILLCVFAFVLCLYN